MLFHVSRKKVTTPILEIDSHVIEFVTSFNYLGILFDEHLQWKTHTDTVSKKSCKKSRNFEQNENFLHSEILLNIYNALIVFYLNYRIIKLSNFPYLNGFMPDFQLVEVILLLKEIRSTKKCGIGHCTTTISDFDVR